MANKTVELLIEASIELEKGLMAHPSINHKFAFEITVFSFFITSQCYIQYVYNRNKSGEIFYRPEIMNNNIAEMLSFAVGHCVSKDKSFFTFNKNNKVLGRLDQYKPYTGKYFVLATMLNKNINNKLDVFEKQGIAASIEAFSMYLLSFIDIQIKSADDYDDISDMPAPTGRPGEGVLISDTSKSKDLSSLKLY